MHHGKRRFLHVKEPIQQLSIGSVGDLLKDTIVFHLQYILILNGCLNYSDRHPRGPLLQDLPIVFIVNLCLEHV